VRQVFRCADRHLLTNALVFREPGALVHYYASSVVDRITGRPADNTHR
jgi:hypothetical protein